MVTFRLLEILMKPFRIGRTNNNSKKLKHLRPNGRLMLNMKLGPVLQKWMREIKQKYK